jgi:hypothetical protein
MIFGGCRGFSIFLGGLENAMWTPVFPIRQILHGVHVKKKNTHGMGPGESNSWVVLDFSDELETHGESLSGGYYEFEQDMTW